MSRRKGLVLDANILLRAVFGQRVRELLEAYEDEVGFYSPGPDICFDDARKYIPDVSGRRKIDPAHSLLGGKAAQSNSKFPLFLSVKRGRSNPERRRLVLGYLGKRTQGSNPSGPTSRTPAVLCNVAFIRSLRARNLAPDTVRFS